MASCRSDDERQTKYDTFLIYISSKNKVANEFKVLLQHSISRSLLSESQFKPLSHNSEKIMYFKRKRCVSTDKIVHHLTGQWTNTMDFLWVEFLSGFTQVFLVQSKRVSLL